jgi:hypothetical protein
MSEEQEKEEQEEQKEAQEAEGFDTEPVYRDGRKPDERGRET